MITKLKFMRKKRNKSLTINAILPSRGNLVPNSLKNMIDFSVMLNLNISSDFAPRKSSSELGL